MDILLPYYRVTGGLLIHTKFVWPSAQRQGPRYMLRQTINRNVAPTNVKRLFRLSDCAISGRYAETEPTLPRLNPSSTALSIFERNAKDQPRKFIDWPFHLESSDA
jgi:hypothetical protein